MLFFSYNAITVDTGIKVFMNKQEWRDRLKGIGIRVGEAAKEMGFEVNTVYRWTEIPKVGYWYLISKENENQDFIALKQRMLDAIYKE